jgi:hypothetical protein
MNRYIRDDLPTLLPRQPFEGFQGGPDGGVWVCTAFYPVPPEWDLAIVHPEVVLLGRGCGIENYFDLYYQCPYCGIIIVEDVRDGGGS